MAIITPTAFRNLMGSYATGIAVATIHDPEIGKAGLTINSLTSVSLDPMLVLFCLDKKAHLHASFRRAEHFAINILSAEQREVSQHFANHQKFPCPKGVWGKERRGCPILRHTLGSAVCRVTAIHKGGDHSIFVGKILDLYQPKEVSDPLLYFKGRYRVLG